MAVLDAIAVSADGVGGAPVLNRPDGVAPIAAVVAALTAEDLADHPNGLLLSIPRSKTNQIGDQAELVVLPRGSSQPHRSPTAALDAWLDTARITTGPVFRPVSKGNRALNRPLNPESINT